MEKKPQSIGIHFNDIYTNVVYYIYAIQLWLRQETIYGYEKNIFLYMYAVFP